MIRPKSKPLELSINISCELVIFYDKKGKKFKEIEFNKILDTVFLQEIVKKGFFRKPYYKLKLDKDEFFFDETSYERFMEDYSEVRNKYLASLQKIEPTQKLIEQKNISAITKKQEKTQKKIVKPKKKNRKTNTKINAKEKNIEITTEKNQTRRVTPPKMAEVYSIINKALHNTGLNKYEIENNIVVTTNVRQELDLQIDLHSLTVEVANNVLLKTLNITQLSMNQIKLIHGYNKGTVLKNFIANDFTHSRIQKKEVDASNEGITILKLKAIDESIYRKKKVKLKSANSNLTASDKKNESRESIKDASDFILIMIKEKVRSGDIKSREFNRIYESVLNEDECKYCNELFKYDFELAFFLDSVREFYEYKGIQYIKISYKKKNYDECNRLLEKLIEKFPISKIECEIKVEKNIGKKLIMQYNELSETYYQISLLNQNEVLLKGGF